MKAIRKMILAGLVAAGMAFGSDSIAQDRSAEGASFNGKVTSVDKSAQTVVVNGQTYQMLATSRITKEKQPATLNDLAAGDQVAGQFKRSDANKMEVLVMDITKGTAAATAGTVSAETSEAGASFSGKVSKVDPATQTLTIGSQTYQALATTVFKKDNQSASFSDLAVGDDVSGRYKRSDANKMEVLAMDITKAAQAVAANAGTIQGGASFNGKVSRVDPATKMVTIGSQTFQALATTVFTRNNQAASFDDIKVGSALEGRYKISDAGRPEFLTVNISGDAATAVGGTQDPAAREVGASFQGEVAKVNAATQTVKIGKQTYRILPSTVISRGDGRPATFTTLKAEQKVSGTYRVAANGDLELLTLQIGRAGRN